MNKRPWRYWFTYLYTLIWDIPCWVVLVIMWALWGCKLHWFEGVWFEIKVGSWLDRRFKGWSGVTFGHGGFYSPGKVIDSALKKLNANEKLVSSDGEILAEKSDLDFLSWEDMAKKLQGDLGMLSATEFHEHVHVEQYEAGMLRVFLVAAAFLISAGVPSTAEIVICLIIWFSGAFTVWVPNWIQAWMRGEAAYSGSNHEEAAYSLTREYERRKNGL